MRHNGKALIFSIQDDAGWAKYLTSGLQECLGRKGISTETFVGANPDARANVQTDAKDVFDLGRYDVAYYFVYNVNRRPTLAGGDDLFKRFSSPVLTHVIDNPVHLTRVALDTSQDPKVDCFLYSDADNEDVVRRLTNGRRIFHLPLLGRPCDVVEPRMAARPIDVFFAGNVGRAKGVTEFLFELENADIQTRTAVSKSIDMLVESRGRISLLPTVVECFREQGVARLEYDLLSRIDLFVRNYHRTRLISSLTDVQVDLCGMVENDHVLKMKNVRVHGFKDFESCLDMASQSKVTLGDIVNFTGGVELRPAMAMSKKSVYADCPNTFIETHFRNDQSAIFFRHDLADAGERIKAYLQDNGKLAAMAESAAAIYDQALTWDAWIDRLLEIVDEFWATA